MKILHVCPLYYPSIGGNQSHIQILSEELAKLGEEVHVFTSNASIPAQFNKIDPQFNYFSEREMINGVQIRRFKPNYKLHNLLFDRIFKLRGGFRFLHAFFGKAFDFWNDGPIVLKMLNEIRILKPDLVMGVMSYHFTIYVCYLAKKLFNVRFIFMPITHIADQRTFNPFLKKIYQAADHIIACTEFERDYLTSQGVPFSKITVLPLGIDRNMFSGQDGSKIRKKFNINHDPIVAYIGRKVRHKGIEALLEAMPMVWEKFPNVNLMIAGKVRENFVKVINKALAKYSPEQLNRTFNIPDFDEEDKKDFFAAMDIFVMPSEIDCFGIVYLEAWLSGKPVIACRNMPQESMVDDGKDGWLVGYNNKDELAEKILSLLIDKDLREKMGCNGREKVLKVHEINSYVQSVRKCYLSLGKV